MLKPDFFSRPASFIKKIFNPVFLFNLAVLIFWTGALGYFWGQGRLFLLGLIATFSALAILLSLFTLKKLFYPFTTAVLCWTAVGLFAPSIVLLFFPYGDVFFPSSLFILIAILGVFLWNRAFEMGILFWLVLLDSEKKSHP